MRDSLNNGLSKDIAITVKTIRIVYFGKPLAIGNFVTCFTWRRLASITSDESETPPELPAKTRRNIRADVQQSFPTVEIR